VILVSDSRAQYAARKAEIDAAIARVLASGRYILGEEVAAFEREFAAYCGVAHGVGVNSGTDALIIALRALGIGKGDEVITVSHTAVATVAAIVAVGAHPVLVDIDPATFTIDAPMIERAIGPRTRAIVPVHLYGLPADMDAVMDIAGRHGLKVIEDCAQATGARHRGRPVGSIGHVGCFSFYPTKNLGAVGDGGLTVTNDDGVAARARSLRQYGWNDARDSQLDGVNSRLDEVQAAVLRAKLPHLDADNRKRASIAAVYDNALSDTGLSLPRTPERREHVYHLYVVRSTDRDRLREALRESGVAAGIHYPVPVHLQPAFRDRGMTPWALPHSEQAAAQVLSLPLYPELTDDQLQTVVSAIRAQTTLPDRQLLRTS
jgi:dTDP-4-amino-4,6-dideoxygalactose transaminase